MPTAKPRAPMVRPGRSDVPAGPHVTATEAKTEFGRLLDMAIAGDAVVITKHDAPKAVLLSVEKFNELSRGRRGVLDSLTDEFGELLASMQAPGSRAAMQAAFEATPAQLGRAAVAAVRRRTRRRA